MRVSWLFCVFKHSPENKVWQPKQGKYTSKDMVKIQNIFEIESTLGFTEFDILKKYQKSFVCSEFDRLHSLFPFSSLAGEMSLKASPLGRRSYFSAGGKIVLMVLKSYTGLSDRHLIEHLNSNIHSSSSAIFFLSDNQL